jgi:hypothetical protein
METGRQGVQAAAVVKHLDVIDDRTPGLFPGRILLIANLLGF